MLGAAAVAGLAALAGCSGPAADDMAPPPTRLTVSAAASLTDAFNDIADAFMSAHPGVTVVLNFGGSSALAEQINAGAPVDVFASASVATMATVVDAGSADAPVAFARNVLAVVSPAANPAGITTLADIAGAGVTVAACAREVPCGAATERLLELNGLEVTPVTLDPDVRSVLARVTSDEVDAGIVYATDALAAGDDVVAIAIPDDRNVATEYLIATISQSANPALAAEFAASVVGPAGQQALAERGFRSP